MREYVPALRSLLAGDEVTTSGRYVTLDAVRLDWPPEVAPKLFAAAEGPKTLALSGEVADGTVLTGGTSVDQVSAARGLIAEGRAAAGRPLDHEVVVYAAAAFGGDAGARATPSASSRAIPSRSQKASRACMTPVRMPSSSGPCRPTAITKGSWPASPRWGA
jgi:alkanesulfonate monooxygenase SsuD/methylene tetrahydromethanopterin reductase-like flavin-dependent oxidoreductase (luciferase family)